MSFESFDSQSQAEQLPQKPEKSAEISHEKLVTSLRARFKKALSTTILPVIFAGAFTVTPEQIGYNKKDVAEMLNNQAVISDYIEAAKVTSYEGEMGKKEQITLRQTYEKGFILQKKLGIDNVNKMMDAQLQTKIAKKNKPQVFTEKFKDIGIDPELVKTTFEKLPEHWKKQIKTVTCEPKFEKLDKNYSHDKDTLSAARAIFHSVSGLTDIKFFKLPEKWSEKFFREVLYHEAAHPNDWSARYRSVQERINMLYQTLNRFKSNNRHHSDYVESIKNPDKQLETSLKVGEYWSEIVRQYFENKNLLPQQDRELVEKFIKTEENPIS